MRDGADPLCGPLNYRKWLPVHLWEYKLHYPVGLSESLMVVLDADDTIISLTTRCPLSHRFFGLTVFLSSLFTHSLK